MVDLKGKMAIVTGGAMGIGFSTCKRLIQEGCSVTIWDLDRTALEKARHELKDMGGTVFAYHCDVSDEKRVKELVQQAEKDMGLIDILINNAGFVRSGKFFESPLKDAVRQMDVNVNSLFYTIHAVLPAMMKRNKGHIVNVSSGVGIISAPGLAPYTASKWAVWGLTDVLRLELMAEKKNGIKFTSVHPGNVVTGMFEGFKLNLLGRLVSPSVKNHDVIAKAIVHAGLKRQSQVVCRPRSLHLAILFRGLIPNPLFSRLVLLAGLGECMNDFTGRQGYIHSNPANNKK